MNQRENRIDRLFADRTRKRFIPFLTVGDPSLEATFQLAHGLVEAGADLLELGVPYSDPLADGPTIQRASQRALANGVTIKDALELVERLRQSGMETPLVLFTYINPVLQYGIDRLFADLAAKGADGIVIPDLPVEENAPCSKSGYGAWTPRHFTGRSNLGGTRSNNWRAGHRLSILRLFAWRDRRESQLERGFG